MAQVAASFPAIAQLVNLTDTYGTPRTHGGRSLFALRISDNVGEEEDEPSFLLVAAHHGNEIGTPVVALDVIRRLTEGYGSDPAITGVVDEYEIWIAPLWNPDGYPGSRKNGRPGGGVDLNRNYPFLWDTGCSGSTNPSSGNFKGPSPGSEPETQTMMALSLDQAFTKVLDLHSQGREVVFGYRCSPHPLEDYLEAEAAALAHASSYEGHARRPSAEGEHYHWQMGLFGNHAFLLEISDTQSPSYAYALQEAIRVWPGVLWQIRRPIPIWGHVKDATTGEPVVALITYLETSFSRGEENRSEARFGRYHAFLPTGSHTLRFSAPGYVTQDLPVDVTAEGVRMEVLLQPEG
jgi:hypothetical protein